MTRRCFFGLIWLLLPGLLMNCNAKKTEVIRIAVAANAHFAIEQLAAEFTKQTAIKTEIIVGSSGKLTTQISNGAPFDLFFAANTEYPALLHKQQFGDQPITYGYGIPVIWTVKNKLDLDCSGTLSSLRSNAKIAIANPLNAPYGQTAIQFLKDKNLLDSLQPYLIYGESVSQINEYVMNESVVIGFTAKSIVVSPKLQGIGIFCELDSNYWIEQSVIIINKVNKAQKLLDFATSEQGKAIFNQFGYAQK